MSRHNYHRLLKRQLRKSGILTDKLTQEQEKLLNLINLSYHNHDDERKLLESSIEISSEEFRLLYEDLKAKKFQLEKSFAVLSEFSYVAAHDLKEPLRTISSFTQLININCKDKLDGEIKEYLDLIQSSAGHMDKLIKSLMAYSRLDSLELKKDSRISISNIIDNVKENLFDLIETSEANITMEGDVKLNCDALSIYQLFQNLISNSIKYKSEDLSPEIHIKTEDFNDYKRISITDNGIGIDHDYRNIVFEPFKRLHNREKYCGAGIGLSICQKVVSQHGGEIWIDPDYTEGTQIHFTLKDISLNRSN